ncbi:hypothetical protein [Vibrio sp. 16]|uniref:hypothetical protein n=1 Tax=Vibrio sp. 16 TaxID=391586 RepID=UPI0002E29F55|nr:hypothetical protein [Vibrio sp. 16]CAK4067931.1 hypothetical protein VDT1_0847 [Vibrio sp. 16]
MKTNILILSLLLSTNAHCADDAEWNAIAKKLKARIEKKIANHSLPGYCNVFIEFKHSKYHAIVTRVNTNGDFKICNVSKHLIKKGEKFRYRTPEKYLRIHVANE